MMKSLGSVYFIFWEVQATISTSYAPEQVFITPLPWGTLQSIFWLYMIWGIPPPCGDLFRACQQWYKTDAYCQDFAVASTTFSAPATVCSWKSGNTVPDPTLFFTHKQCRVWQTQLGGSHNAGTRRIKNKQKYPPGSAYHIGISGGPSTSQTVKP